MTEAEESWERAEKLLLGAVDVLQLKVKTEIQPLDHLNQLKLSHMKGVASIKVSVSTQALSAASSSFMNKPRAYDEHRYLFGYQPARCTLANLQNVVRERARRMRLVLGQER